jgi:hypothetical protein
MKKLRCILFIALLLAVGLNGTVARADMWMNVNIDVTDLAYDSSAGTIHIEQTTGSTLLGTLFDDAVEVDSADISNKIENVTIPGYGTFNDIYPETFTAFVDLNTVKVGSQWTATGSVHVSDINGDRIVGQFKSSSISIRSNVGANQLVIKGSIFEDPLLTGADPWVFQGENQSLYGADDPGLDNEDDRITIENWTDWKTGIITTMNYETTASSLQEFFESGYDQTGFNGTIDINIIPLPGAALLGMLGLGVVGLKLRRRKA